MFMFGIKKSDLDKIIPLVVPDDFAHMPILGHIHFLVSAKGVDLAATSLDWTKRHVLPATVTEFKAKDKKKEIAVSVHFKEFKKLLGLLPKGDDLTLSWVNDTLSIHFATGKLHIVTLETDSVRDLLDMPSGPLLATVPTADFKELIDSVKYAVCKDDTKYNLTNVFIRTERKTKTLRSCATNGHRLALHTVKAEQGARIADGIMFSRELISILPGFTGKEITIHRFRVMDKDKDKKPYIKLEQVVFACGPYSVWQKTSDRGLFPDVSRVLPTDDGVTTRAKVDPAKMVPVLKRASAIGTEKFKGAMLTFDKGKGAQLQVSVSNPMSGTGLVENVACDYQEQQEPVDFRINSLYLIDALNQCGGAATINIKSPEIPIKIVSGNDTMVVMPMRL
jgi:DNA polymerase-3 subunit beta